MGVSIRAVLCAREEEGYLFLIIQSAAMYTIQRSGPPTDLQITQEQTRMCTEVGYTTEQQADTSGLRRGMK